MKRFKVKVKVKVPTGFNRKNSDFSTEAHNYVDLCNELLNHGVREIAEIEDRWIPFKRILLALFMFIAFFAGFFLSYEINKHPFSKSTPSSENINSTDSPPQPNDTANPKADDLQKQKEEKTDKNRGNDLIDKYPEGDELVPPEVPRPPKLEWLPNGTAVRYDKKGRKIVVTNPEDYPYYKALSAIKNPNKKQPTPYFKHDIENSLWNFAVPGQEVPPIPNDFSEADIAAALEEPLVIEEGDTENDIYKKEAVQMLKDEMKDYLTEGHTIEEYFEEIAKRQQAEADLVNETRTMAMRSLENDEIDLAVKLIDKLNEHLKEKGLPPMKLPAPYRKYLKEYQGK